MTVKICFGCGKRQRKRLNEVQKQGEKGFGIGLSVYSMGAIPLLKHGEKGKGRKCWRENMGKTSYHPSSKVGKVGKVPFRGCSEGWGNRGAPRGSLSRRILPY